MTNSRFCRLMFPQCSTVTIQERRKGGEIYKNTVVPWSPGQGRGHYSSRHIKFGSIEILYLIDTKQRSICVSRWKQGYEWNIKEYLKWLICLINFLSHLFTETVSINLSLPFLENVFSLNKVVNLTEDLNVSSDLLMRTYSPTDQLIFLLRCRYL